MRVGVVSLGEPDHATLAAVGDLFLKVLARVDSQRLNGCSASAGVPMAAYNPCPTSPDSTTPRLERGEGRAAKTCMDLMGESDATTSVYQSDR